MANSRVKGRHSRHTGPLDGVTYGQPDYWSVYGWVARLGLILPMDNAVIEPELYGLRLEGVAYFTVRLTTSDRSEMPADGTRLSSIFNELGVDAVGYACAETSFLAGLDANTWIMREIEAVTSRPAVTASAAMVEALRALGARSVALVAPYRASSAERLRSFFERSGFIIASMLSRNFAESHPEQAGVVRRERPAADHGLRDGA